MMRPLNRPAQIGDVIASKYRLVRSLGRGGMGRIFEADHLMLDTKVALKFMHPHLTRDPVSVGRFAREARAAATLKSEHAARIIDVDQLASGELYIVMEYLEGRSLETMARGGRSIPILDAVMYISQACEALAEAHDRGIIHRDVKPANLFLTKGKSGEPMIKVLDFGLAKSSEAEGTASGVLQALGTPQYMSPEQIRGSGTIDPRSDVWSIGVTLYELLTGRRAFDARSTVNVFAAVLSGRYTPIRDYRADAPAALVAVVDRCLAAEPSARFASVRDLSAALAAVKHMLLAPRSLMTAQGFNTTLVSPGSDAWDAMPTVMPLPITTPTPMPMALSILGPATSSSSHRPPSYATLRPATMSLGPASSPDSEPSARQTMFAALAGPALVAAAAAVIAVVLGFAAHPAAVVPVPMATVTYLTAKSAGVTRAKAPVVETREPRVHRTHGSRPSRHAP